MTGYRFTIDGITYDAHRDGRPLTLPDCWRAVEGCGAYRRDWLPTIYAPNGRVVLSNAGSLTARHEHIKHARRINRTAAARRGARVPLADLIEAGWQVSA